MSKATARLLLYILVFDVVDNKLNIEKKSIIMLDLCVACYNMQGIVHIYTLNIQLIDLN